VQKKLKMLVITLFVIAMALSTMGAPYATNMTGAWTNAGGGVYTSNAGDVQVNASAKTSAGGSWSDRNTGTTTSDGTFFSNASAAKHQSLESTFSGSGVLTFKFGTNVTNPVLHIDRIGGAVSQGWNDYTSSSANFTVTSGQTLVKLTGPSHFNVTSTSFFRTPNRDTAGNMGASWDSRDGTAAGSIQFLGTFDTITLAWTSLGPSNEDELEFVWELNCPKTSLSVVKSADKASYNVGDLVRYTVHVVNAGPDAATNVVVSDVLPAGLTFAGASNGGSYNAATGVITWNLASLAKNGFYDLFVNATVNSGTQGQTLPNTASAYCDQNKTPVTSNTVSVYVNKAVLSVVKSADKASYNVGDLVRYTVHVVNAGPDAATNVVVSDVLPAGLTFAGASNGGSYNAATGVITWNLASLAKNGFYDLFVNATVNSGTQGQTLPNTASAYCDQNKTPVTSNTVSVYVNKAPLTVTKTTDRDSANYNVGENVIYKIEVSNGVEVDDATGVVVIDTLPTGLTYVSSTNGGVWDPNTRTITWNLGDLKCGSNFTLYVNATVTSDAAAQTLNNTASATDDQMESPVSATASIYVPSADLVLTKTVNNTKPVVKDIVVFTLIVNNHGPDTSTNVQVADKLPQGLTFVKYTASTGTYDPATGIWTIGDLKNGETAWINITSAVDQVGNITNNASVTSLTYDPNIEGSSASASIDAQQSQSGGGGVTPDDNSGNYSSVGAETVAMQKTGVPLGMILTALLMLVTGLVMPRKK